MHSMPCSPAVTLLQTRRSLKPHELIAPGPSAGDLDTMLTIASRVPDHGKLAPWRFIVFEGDARLKAGDAIAAAFTAKYPQSTSEQTEVERLRFARAPLVIAVVSCIVPSPKIPEWEQVMSVGAVTMNLVIAANALGFGTAWLSEWYAYDRGVLDAFGLLPHEKIAGFVHIGRPVLAPEDRPRPALADIVTRFGSP